MSGNTYGRVGIYLTMTTGFFCILFDFIPAMRWGICSRLASIQPQPLARSKFHKIGKNAARAQENPKRKPGNPGPRRDIPVCFGKSVEHTLLMFFSQSMLVGSLVTHTRIMCITHRRTPTDMPHKPKFGTSIA